jgi:hypothetical protein
MTSLLKLLYRRPVRKASYQIFLGRMIERGRPERGRFLRGDVDTILKETWRNVDAMLPAAELEKLPTLGNRHNVFLAVLTVAGYHAYLSAGIEKEYAIELFADVGWKLYSKAAILPRLVARLMTRDPQKRLELMLRMLMIFPFSAPGRPGYEVKARAVADHFCTYWTHCPPHAFVRKYVERNGNRGELDAFRRSWCWYDWAITEVMVGGQRREGYYERPHTMSQGDEVCDMCWYARRPQDEIGMENRLRAAAARRAYDATER